MPCKCTKIYKFCEPVQTCEQESFAALFEQLAAGEYTLQLDYLGTVQQVTMVKDETGITFPDGLVLNENFTYTAQIVDTPLVFADVEYDCFSFTTLNYSSYSATPASTTYLQDVIAGDNVTIDKTNPKKPVISATGGGGGGDVSKAYVDAADTVLQGGIDAEAATRATADNNLQDDINAVDNTLSQEIINRGVSEGILQGNIDSEVAARIAADNNKVDKINGYGLSQENYTLAEKQKLAGLESSKFKGQFTSLADLIAANLGEVGAWAYVDEGVGENVQQYIWDSTDAEWVLQLGESTAETPTSVKAKYESNPDTNAYSDAEKGKLASITEIFTTALKTAYDNTVNWITTNGSNLISHLTNTSNPHSVTATQVGLGNADNTSDANKPVSTPQASAIALKADNDSVVKLAGDQTIAGEKTIETIRQGYGSITGDYRQTFSSVNGTGMYWKWGNNGSDNVFMEVSLAAGKNNWHNKGRDFVMLSNAASNSFYVKASNGFCGFGNGAPTERVDVTGNIKASGTVTGSNIRSTTIGTAAPATTPTIAGEWFIDTTNKKAYVATGTSSSADWTLVN